MDRNTRSNIEIIIFAIVWVAALIILLVAFSGCNYPAVGNAGSQITHDALKLEEEVDIIFEELKTIFVEFQTIDEEINELYSIEDVNERKIKGITLTQKLDNLGERFSKINFGKVYKYSERIRILGEELTRWAGGTTMAINDDTFHIVLHELIQDRIMREKQRILGTQIASKVIGVVTGGVGGDLWGELIAGVLGVTATSGALYKNYKNKKGKQKAEQELEKTDRTLGVVVKAAETLREDKPKMYDEFKARVKAKRPEDNVAFEAVVARHKE